MLPLLWMRDGICDIVYRAAFFVSTLWSDKPLPYSRWQLVQRIPKYWLYRNVWGALDSGLSPLPQLWTVTFLHISLHARRMFLQPSATTCTVPFTVKLRQYFFLKRRNEPHTLYGVKSRNTGIFRMTTRMMFRKFISILSVILGTQWRSWLRHCATNRTVAGSIPDGVTGIFHWHNPSGRTMALGLTQPLTEMSTRNISWGGKGGRCVGLTTLPPSYADCLEIWEPQPSGTLRACPGL